MEWITVLQVVILLFMYQLSRWVFRVVVLKVILAGMGKAVGQVTKRGEEKDGAEKKD